MLSSRRAGLIITLSAPWLSSLLGAALINSFAWVFYLFGLILLVTAGNLVKPALM